MALDKDLLGLTMAEARRAMDAGELTSRALTEAYLAAVEASRPLNIYVTETPERALADADAADARIRAGDAAPMTGMPIAMKDLFCTEGVRTTAASRILGGFAPPYESTVSAKLKAAGTVLLGKANLDEFAMGSSTTTSAFGDTVNPWSNRVGNRPLTAGGSSGGSAAAVAAGPTPAARSASRRPSAASSA